MNDYENAFIQDVKNQTLQEVQSKTPEKKPKNRKFLLIFIIVLVFISLGAGVTIWSLFFKQSQIICASDKGDITINYTREKIVDYKANGMELNIEGQNKIFKRLGSEEYARQFKAWFKKSSGVDCKN